MALQVTRVTNANVYLDGNTMLGKVETFDIPEFKAKMSDHKALGLVGELQLPAGIEKLEAKLKTAGLYADVMKKAFNIYGTVSLQIRANAEEYQGSARVSETPIKIFLQGSFMNGGGAKFQARDNVDNELSINVTYMKVVYGSESIVEYDVTANIYRVNGEDLLATYRANLG